MSRECVEYIQLIYGGGTTKEFFAEYLQDLINVMKEKYQDKKIVFVLDNLGSHKTSEVHKVMEDR